MPLLELSRITSELQELNKSVTILHNFSNNLELLLLPHKYHFMKDVFSKCFVCDQKIDSSSSARNQYVNLPVCESCKGTKAEKDKQAELLEGMADGFVCGCI